MTTLTPSDASRGFVFGYMNPDGPYRAELWYVPGATYPLYVLTPFHSELYWVESGFLDPLNWVSVSGPCAEVELSFRFFEPKNRRMTLALDHFQPIPVAFARNRIFELLPECVTKMERVDPSGRLSTWLAWSPAIGGRVTVSSHIQEFDDIIATRVDAEVTENSDGDSVSGADITIDYDRDASAIVDAAVKALSNEGFELRYRRIR